MGATLKTLSAVIVLVVSRAGMVGVVEGAVEAKRARRQLGSDESRTREGESHRRRTGEGGRKAGRGGNSLNGERRLAG